VHTVGGEDASCTELDPTTTQQERIENAEECAHLARKTKNQVVGRLVRQCSEAGFTARCKVPGRPVNYVSTANPEALKGSRLGCIAGGGTFSVD
jgi:hypothetical protein